MCLLTGISNLNELLNNMKPKLVNENLVFCSVSEKQYKELKISPIMIFQEIEGITLIIPKKIALKNSLCHSNTTAWSMISLTVHSSLEAIGFIAEITKYLTRFDVSTNVVSAFYHDHLFVQSEET
ncbi:unnamed protein product, partial [marine sediment metagenome]